MYKIFYQVSSLYPYYYYVTLVFIGKQCDRLVTADTFEHWEQVIDFAKSYKAELIFDGII